VSAEVIDVRSLSPFDFDTIGESVQKTGRVVIVEEGPKTGGVGAELSASIAERFGRDLKAPWSGWPRPTCRCHSRRCWRMPIVRIPCASSRVQNKHWSVSQGCMRKGRKALGGQAFADDKANESDTRRAGGLKNLIGFQKDC